MLAGTKAGSMIECVGSPRRTALLVASVPEESTRFRLGACGWDTRLSRLSSLPLLCSPFPGEVLLHRLEESGSTMATLQVMRCWISTSGVVISTLVNNGHGRSSSSWRVEAPAPALAMMRSLSWSRGTMTVCCPMGYRISDLLSAKLPVADDL